MSAYDAELSGAPEDASSIRRDGENADYRAQDLPFATFPSRPGVVYRAGIEVGGRRCPRCSVYIVATSKVVRLRRPEKDRWWVHERCNESMRVNLKALK